MGSKTAKQTVKEKKNPWAPTVAPLTANVEATSAASKNLSLFTPTQSASTLAGIKGLEAFGRAPSMSGTASGVAKDYMTRGAPVGLDELIATARGDRMAGNPFIDEMIKNQGEDISSSISGMFSGAGRLGSGANQSLIADRLGRLNTETRMNDYNTERGYQVNAAGALAAGGQTYAGMSPALDTAALMPAGAMLQAGEMRDGFEAGVRTAPLAALDYERGAVGGLSGIGGTGTSTTKSKQPSQLASQILGGAMMAGQMYMGMPPGMGFGGGYSGSLSGGG